MYLAKQIIDLSVQLTQKQLEVISSFLAAPVNWSEVTHGEKQQLAEKLSIVFVAAEGTEQWTNVLEAHRKFYDLHCTAEGNDIIVAKPVKACSNIRTEYTDEGDYILYNEVPEERVEVPAGVYCLIPPADAHMALYGKCGFVRKLVFKIPVA